MLQHIEHIIVEKMPKKIVLMEIGAWWLVGMAGFLHSGITSAVDGQEMKSDDEPSESSSDVSTRDFSDLSDEDHTDF